MFAQINCWLLIIIFALLIFSGYAHADTISPNYSLIDKINLPGPTRWDYLAFDSNTHHLFITRGESVDVLDITTKEIVGTIHDTNGVHGVALAPELGKGFTSNGKANTATVFDFATFKPIATIQTGIKPDAIVYDPRTQRVFTANGDGSDMTVINAVNGMVIRTIELSGKPEFAVVDGKGQLYVNLEDKSQIAVVDTKNLKVISHYNLGPSCDSPTGLAIDVDQHRLFSVCGNKVMVVVNAKTGKIIDTLPIGASADAAAFDSKTKLVFSSNGDGTLTVINASDPNHYKVIQTVATMLTARTMALDAQSHQIYLAAAETDGIDPTTAQSAHVRPHMKPDSFMILTVGEQQ